MVVYCFKTSRRNPTLIFITLLITLVFFAALSSETSAQYENFNNLTSLDMQFTISSEIPLRQTESAYEVEYISADLSFFPRENDYQDVFDYKIISFPEAETTQTERLVKYKWTKVDGQKLNLGLDAKVRTKNTLPKISKKLNFPIQYIDNDILQYTQATEFIDITPEIEKQAREIIGTETDLLKVVFKVADWTKNNIVYNLSTLTADAVQKSSWVLKNRKGVCDELTNLFISMLRSVGIPARFVSGVVYTNLENNWGPHGWAEVYFPEYGWIPFDVTFGEYAWLDPSHIKLKDDKDSGSPTVQYSWKTYGIELDIKELQLETELLNTGQPLQSQIMLSAKPIRENVGFGSFVPLQIVAENPKGIYLSTSIIVRKAPGLVGSNVRQILLAPKETKTIYFMLQVSDSLEEGYIYTSPIEVRDSFGSYAESKLVYASEYPKMSKQESERIISSFEPKEEKPELADVDISCSTDRQMYYSNESAEITCTLRSTKALSVNICLIVECKDINIKPGAEAESEVKLTIPTISSGRIPIIAEAENKIKYTYINLNVISVPNIIVSDISPQSVNYKDSARLSFTVKSDTTINNIKIDFGFSQINLPSLRDPKQIEVETAGKNLLRGLKFHVSYYDEAGKKYDQNIAINIEVKNVPWYAKMINWMASLF